MADAEYRRLTCSACSLEFTQPRRGRPAKHCEPCRAPKTASRPRRLNLACDRCGDPLPQGAVRWCSSRCRLGTTMTRAEYRESVRSGAAGRFTCEHCGADAFRSDTSNRKRGSGNRFCSMACRKAQAAAKEHLKSARKELLAALRRLARRKEAPPTTNCRYTPAVRTCPACGLQWSGFSIRSGSSQYCQTPACQAAHDAAVRKANRLTGKHTQRAKRQGRRYRYFNVMAVFERDRWTCQLCGVKTPKKLRGTVDPRAPEIDHITPLAAGGDHLPENCQCACRRCNRAKGATPRGQMLLVG